MAAPLVVIGGGRMGEALVAGLLAQDGTAPERIVVVETSAERQAELSAAGGLAGRSPAVTVASEPPEGAEVILVVQAACEQLAGLGPRRVLSVAAGVTIERLERWLAQPVPVVRAMPNTPALVGASASAIAGGTHAGAGDLAWAEGILGSVGTVVRVNEGLLDAVTGLSGSGPAYVFLLAEAMVDAGVLVGLPRPVATALTVQTLVGSARLLAESGQTAESLRAGVTSPGGTTAAGLRALEAASVRAAVLDAVSAATERAAELGRA
ncbi:MAG: pyrroline-5-carboxylate reductase [Actinomycetota bacterium]|nr:pyrroline-5-carboxylate reductase [Actinomycetota bacterium]